MASTVTRAILRQLRRLIGQQRYVNAPVAAGMLKRMDLARSQDERN